MFRQSVAAALLLANAVLPASAEYGWRSGTYTFKKVDAYLTYKLIEKEGGHNGVFAIAFVVPQSVKVNGERKPSVGWLNCRNGRWDVFADVPPDEFSSEAEVVAYIENMTKSFCTAYRREYSGSAYF